MSRRRVAVLGECTRDAGPTLAALLLARGPANIALLALDGARASCPGLRRLAATASIPRCEQERGVLREQRIDPRQQPERAWRGGRASGVLVKEKMHEQVDIKRLDYPDSTALA